MKLIIQIPCYNEEEQLPATLAALPKTVPGVDTVEILVINDGSTDRTAEIARERGVHHIVQLSRNAGLATAFTTGLEASLKAGADIIVNTDADNQYHADDIPKLIQPIIDGKADFVIGARPISEISEFSPLKKILQKAGSWAVRMASNTSVEDAPSGFRAFSREAAIKLHVFSRYTYTLETLIQAGQNGIVTTSVPVRVNRQTRPSRLVRSNLDYVFKSCLTILRIFAVYKPLRFFVGLGCIPASLAILIGCRFVYFYMTGTGSGHIQSLILASVLFIIGFNLWTLGLVSDLISVNRRLIEQIHHRTGLLNSKTDGQP